MTLKRSDFYAIATVNGNRELDLINSNINRMDLDIIATFVVPEAMVGRADVISYLYYESVDYDWLILWHNDIRDPFTELVAGMVLEIPSLVDYYNFHNNYAKRTSN